MQEDFKSLKPEQLEALKTLLGKSDTAESSEFADWFDGKKIDEIALGEYLLQKKERKCIHGRLYDLDGEIEDETARKEILDEIRPYQKTNVAKTVERILNTLKLMCQCEMPPIREDRIHFHNGTYHLAGDFSEEKEWTMNRLPVRYNPDAPAPEKWLAFLDDLLEKEDIPVLQEFMGYVMIPSNRGQKMLLMIGNGGEGKSRIGRVLRAILGDNMNTGSIQKLENDRFNRADQEGILLFMDDDMRTEALPSTNNIKSIVTMEDKIDLERKGKQSVQGLLYVRIICFGNGSLKSLHDQSYGFYRRQILLTTKERPADRKDDRYLGDKLIREAEGIVLWCLEGLHRLIRNGFEFSISDRAKKNLKDLMENENNIISFLNSSGYVRREEGTYASSRQLYFAYRKWCEDNLEKPRAENTFKKYLNENAETLGLIYDKNLPGSNGKTVRGFRGIHVAIRTE